MSENQSSVPNVSKSMYLKELLGKTLTIIDALGLQDRQNKATKDLIKGYFSGMWSLITPNDENIPIE